MLKRLTITSLLGLALLFSQGGVLLIAALCPHLRLAVRVCSMPNNEPEMDHSQMAHHDMDQGTLLLSTTGDANASELAPSEGARPCSHCAISASSNATVASLRTAEITKRSAALNVSQSNAVPPSLALSDVAVLTPRDHGPPGEASRPRHVLLNTFRI